MEGVQPLFDGINVVVHAAGGLAPVDETSGHGLVADVEVDDLGAGGDLLLELLALFLREMKMLVKIVMTVAYLLMIKLQSVPRDRGPYEVKNACRETQKHDGKVKNACRQMGSGPKFLINSQLKWFKQREKEEKKIVVQYVCV